MRALDGSACACCTRGCARHLFLISDAGAFVRTRVQARGADLEKDPWWSRDEADQVLGGEDDDGEGVDGDPDLPVGRL